MVVVGRSINKLAIKTAAKIAQQKARINACLPALRFAIVRLPAETVNEIK
jgi:hypothetical protein